MIRAQTGGFRISCTPWLSQTNQPATLYRAQSERFSSLVFSQRASSRFQVWYEMERFPVKGRSQPIDRNCFGCLLQTRDLPPADSRVTAFSSTKRKVEHIRLPACNTEGHGVNDARTRRADLAFKESHVSAVLHAIALQGGLAGSFSRVSFVPRAHCAARLPRLLCGFAPVCH
jgi:hypothetical protein